MDDEDKVFCASCGDFLIDELAIRIEGVHLYKERGSSHDWTTIQALRPYTVHSSASDVRTKRWKKSQARV